MYGSTSFQNLATAILLMKMHFITIVCCQALGMQRQMPTTNNAALEPDAC
jgi:hypothetical protein